ncbi:hypothetical protein [Vibrio owensii]|uniref:hypothetical protein n=1 Tax=Vibrio harveyi group TaxID=717610 RepID=UPI003CC50DEC
MLSKTLIDAKDSFRSEINRLAFPSLGEAKALSAIELALEKRKIADRYLKEHPEFNDEQFNQIGYPLFIREQANSELLINEATASDDSAFENTTKLTLSLSHLKKELSPEQVKKINEIEFACKEEGSISWNDYQRLIYILNAK